MTDVGHTAINAKRVGAAAGLISLGLLGGWMFMGGGDKAPTGETLQPLKVADPVKPLDRGDVREAVYTPPTPRTEKEEIKGQAGATVPRTRPAQSGATHGGGSARQKSPQEKLDELALSAGVGGAVNDKADEQIKAKLVTYGRQSDFKPNGCAGPGLGLIRPATPIRLMIDYKVVNEQAGTVFGHVVAPVMDSKFAVEGIPDGTTFTAEYKATETKGQKRISIGNPTLTRPEPRNDELVINGQMSDRQGAAGVPGTIDYPWVSAGLLVAADTAVQLGTAALSGGGSLIGSIFADQAERPLSKAAKDLLDRSATISLEPGEEVVLLLKSSICADDFWG